MGVMAAFTMVDSGAADSGMEDSDMEDLGMVATADTADISPWVVCYPEGELYE
jgi:hypothetical protein